MYTNVTPQGTPILRESGNLNHLPQFCQKNQLDLLDLLKNIVEGNNVIKTCDKNYQIIIEQSGKIHISTWNNPKTLIIEAFKESPLVVARKLEKECYAFYALGEDKGIPHQHTFAYIQEKFMNYFSISLKKSEYSQIYESIGAYQTWVLFHENSPEKYLLSISQTKEDCFSVALGKCVKSLPQRKIKDRGFIKGMYDLVHSSERCGSGWRDNY
jgi:hypothetical protein